MIALVAGESMGLSTAYDKATIMRWMAHPNAFFTCEL